MQEIQTFEELALFSKAFSSPIRIEILKLLMDRDMNLQEIAAALGVTNGAITSHIKLMEQAGVIHVVNTNGIKGMQKVCSVPTRRFMVVLPSDHDNTQTYKLEIPVGSYVAHEAHPTCGLLTQTEVIGGYDNPLFFDDPRKSQANLIWLAEGFLEYRIPNYLQAGQQLAEIRISQELCSETPVYQKEWPSDIYFSINGVELGHWTAPTDFVMERGLYTPTWWPDNNSQYGLLVSLVVNENGTFIDKKKVGDTTIGDLRLMNGKAFLYRISSPKTARHPGGITLFGRNFGNYNQHINVKLSYTVAASNVFDT